MTHITGPRPDLIGQWIQSASYHAVELGLSFTELLEAQFYLTLTHARQVINEDDCPTCPKDES